jgi:hypothetical protein
MGIRVHPKHIFPIGSLSSDGNEFLDPPIKIVIGTSWRKSSFSTYNGNCVQVGCLENGLIGVRDTKHHGRGPVIGFTRDGWDAFIDGIRAGKFGPA